jgi:hypothetical protein
LGRLGNNGLLLFQGVNRGLGRFDLAVRNEARVVLRYPTAEHNDRNHQKREA